MSKATPTGYSLSGVYCGLKRNPTKKDLMLLVSDRPAAAAGVYTKNLVFAASVKWDRAHTPSDSIRVVVANSGNANACTGERGDADTERMATLAAKTCGAKPEDALVLSTGIIGEFLKMEKIEEGISQAAKSLGSNEESLELAARGILTTDTVHKLARRSLNVGGREITIVGMAKGAAMIGPNMATMLGLIFTDASLDGRQLQRVLSSVVDESFNCISVEGHMSTNDTVLLLANGAAGGEHLTGADVDAFRDAVYDVSMELAKSIVADGEGASHLITIDVKNCETRDEAHKIAKTVAESALVKTAIAGADPNWGRIVSAAGYAGVSFEPAKVSLRVNDLLLYEHGAPVAFDAAVVSASIRENRDTSIVLAFAEGSASVRFWTTDLTAEYVRLNADYHT